MTTSTFGPIGTDAPVAATDREGRADVESLEYLQNERRKLLPRFSELAAKFFGGNTYRTSERGAPWSRIIKDLERELRHLNAVEVVLRMDVEARHIRSDGQLRADARPASSAIMLQFQARNIDGWPRLVYKCDV